MFGHMGSILRVDLKRHKTSREPLDQEDARRYLGGRALAARILFRELKPKIDPLGPENKLIFATGVLTGSMVPGTTRYGVFGKSPLTGIWGESHAAGWFGLELKKAGYDAVIFEGSSDQPVYLWINNDDVEIRDATKIWGRTTGETEENIRHEVGDANARISCIGPAGEKLVRFAGVINDLHRAAGRTGMGAVAGSKKLKAVAARGTKEIPIAEKEKLQKHMESLRPLFQSNANSVALRNHGTAGVCIPMLNYIGIFPTRNFQTGVFERAEELAGEKMTKTMLVGRRACPACPEACIRAVKVESGPFAPVRPEYGGPEYETVASFGSFCGVDSLEAAARAGMLCNMYGLDTISAGNVIAFAIECVERGLLTKSDTDGLDLRWGNATEILKLVEKIASRDGFGNILADGVKKAAERIGKGSEEFSMHVKGMEIPMHDPRGKKGLGLSYAISNRGACHLQMEHDGSYERPNSIPEIGLVKPISRFDATRDKAWVVTKAENFYALCDSLIMCKFDTAPDMAIPVKELTQAVNLVTGWSASVDDLMKCGERGFNLARSFNVREGIGRSDDTLPSRFGEPAKGGTAKGQTLSKAELDVMLDSYYEFRGWDRKTGIPEKAKLEELDLGFAAHELAGI